MLDVTRHETLHMAAAGVAIVMKGSRLHLDVDQLLADAQPSMFIEQHGDVLGAFHLEAPEPVEEFAKGAAALAPGFTDADAVFRSVSFGDPKPLFGAGPSDVDIQAFEASPCELYDAHVCGLAAVRFLQALGEGQTEYLRLLADAARHHDGKLSYERHMGGSTKLRSALAAAKDRFVAIKKLQKMRSR